MLLKFALCEKLICAGLGICSSNPNFEKEIGG